MLYFLFLLEVIYKIKLFVVQPSQIHRRQTKINTQFDSMCTKTSDLIIKRNWEETYLHIDFMTYLSSKLLENWFYQTTQLELPTHSLEAASVGSMTNYGLIYFRTYFSSHCKHQITIGSTEFIFFSWSFNHNQTNNSSIVV